MVRGIEGRSIFADDVDRQDWVDRLATIGPEMGLAVLAWALLHNHFHLLVRTGERPLATTMRRLLTGYAGGFNRRHKRAGHLFQNRYKSILVEEEPYLLELVRYVHLNPLRARILTTLDMLDEYPWAGHSAVLGRVPRPWQAVDEVLGCFGPRSRLARRRYCEYMAEGVAQGRRVDLQGGGLRRSAGGWEIVGDLHRGREHGMADERVLGSGGFVEEVHHTAAAQSNPVPRAVALARLPTLLQRCAALWGITVEELCAGSRRRIVSQARAVAAGLAVRKLGLPMAEIARTLGVSSVAIYHALPQCDAILGRRGLSVEDLMPWDHQIFKSK
jgi:REP element-mobilizing transposase RayT